MTEPEDDVATDSGIPAVAPIEDHVPEAFTDPGFAAMDEPEPEPRPTLRLDDALLPLDPNAVTLWRIGGGISTIVWSALIAMACVPAFYMFEDQWKVIVASGLTLVLLNAVVRIAVVPPIRYRLWRYQLREDQLFLQRGFLVIRRTLIPLVRVQNVDTVQGPIARRFGLWSVVVFTAANAQSIPALSKSQADRLRENIAELARRARDED